MTPRWFSALVYTIVGSVFVVRVLGHLHQGRPQQAVLVRVAFRKTSTTVPVGEARRHLVDERLVVLRIEGLADGIVDDDALALQDGAGARGRISSTPVRRASVAGPPTSRARSRLSTVGTSSRKIDGGSLEAGLATVALHALPEVLEVGAPPQELVSELVALAAQGVDLLARGTPVSRPGPPRSARPPRSGLPGRWPPPSASSSCVAVAALLAHDLHLAEHFGRSRGRRGRRGRPRGRTPCASSPSRPAPSPPHPRRVARGHEREVPEVGIGVLVADQDPHAVAGRGRRSGSSPAASSPRRSGRAPACARGPRTRLGEDVRRCRPR